MELWAHAGGDDDAVWREQRIGIVTVGNAAKFRQDEAMCAYLLATGDQILVEASPYDRIWGIGLGASDPRASDPTRWRDPNLLGFTLMDVRDQLR